MWHIIYGAARLANRNRGYGTISRSTNLKVHAIVKGFGNPLMGGPTVQNPVEALPVSLDMRVSLFKVVLFVRLAEDQEYLGRKQNQVPILYY